MCVRWTPGSMAPSVAFSSSTTLCRMRKVGRRTTAISSFAAEATTLYEAELWFGVDSG